MKLETGCMQHSQTIDNSLFVEITDQPDDFFNSLPLDWQESIVPLWDLYKASSKVFVLEQEGKLVAGGILFSKIPPDTIDKAEAERLFGLGCVYIGFLWVSEGFRGRNLGSTWLQEVRNLLKGYHLWLTIDERRLEPFYVKNGFRIIKEVSNGMETEWVMTDLPE